MNRTLAIATRELADRRLILVTAAVLAVIPFALLLLPGLSRFGAPVVIAMAGGVVAAAYGLGLALVLGSTVIGRDLADKRMSFYFSKPVSGASIWFGKLSAVIATLLLSLTIILVPVLLTAGPEAVGRAWLGNAGNLLAGFVAISCALLLITHAASTMVRSRSLLVFADLAALAAIVTACYLIVRALMAGYAIGLTLAFGVAFAVVLLIALVAGGAWQLSRGRIDPRRNHRELSKFLWATLGGATLLAAAITAWIVSVSPDDLRAIHGEQAPGGKWVQVYGAARYRGDYRAGFFMNLENGAIVRADASDFRWIAAFSRDGRTAVQLDGHPGGPRALERIEFGERDVKVTRTHVMVSARASVVLNDSGTRSATVSHRTLSVDSFHDRRTIAVARLPFDAHGARLFFVTDELVRVYVRRNAHGRVSVDIFELDVPTHRLTRTGGFVESTRAMYFNASADGSKLIVRMVDRDHAAPGLLRVSDGRTGADLGTLPGASDRPKFGVLLGDGRVAAVTTQATGRLLSVYSPAGALEREIALPGVTHVPVFRELSGGRVLFSGRREGKWMTYVVDLSSGAIASGPDNVRPMQPDFFGYHDTDPRHFGVTAERIAFASPDTNALISWKLSTGETRTLIGAP